MVRDASESDGSGRAAETPEGSRRTMVRRRRGWSGQRDGARKRPMVRGGGRRLAQIRRIIKRAPTSV